MSKETPKIDNELAREFDELVQSESRKIKPEEQARRALWALDALKQESRINSETKLIEVIRVIEERKSELRQTIAYAKDTSKSPATDKADTEFHKIAETEAETAERLLGYMEAAWSALMPMKMEGYDSETPLRQIQEKLKAELIVREAKVDQSEENRRHGNK